MPREPFFVNISFADLREWMIVRGHLLAEAQAERRKALMPFGMRETKVDLLARAQNWARAQDDDHLDERAAYWRSVGHLSSCDPSPHEAWAALLDLEMESFLSVPSVKVAGVSFVGASSEAIVASASGRETWGRSA